jgi:hypothetical protein
VFAGQNRDRVSADLVCNVAIGGDAVGSHNYGLNSALAHEAGRHVVANDSSWNSVRHQFPGCEASALEEGTRFVCEDMNLFAPLNCSANDAQSRSVAAGGQRSGVAVGEDAAFLGHQVGAVRSHGFAGGDVLVVHGESVGQQSLLDFCEAGSLSAQPGE